MSRKPFISISLGAKAQNAVTQAVQPKKRNIFVEEEEEEITGPPKRKLIKLDDQSLEQAKLEQKEDELDPLEAFMDTIAKVPDVKQPKARRDDYEDDDDFDTFIKHRNDEIKEDPTLLSEYVNEDYDSSDEKYLEKIRADDIVYYLH